MGARVTRNKWVFPTVAAMVGLATVAVTPTAEDRLWVMGDNRANSEDSRYHQNLRGNGTIPVTNVVGKVFAIVWPLGRFTLVHRPETFEQEALQRDPMKRR